MLQGKKVLTQVKASLKKPIFSIDYIDDSNTYGIVYRVVQY